MVFLYISNTKENEDGEREMKLVLLIIYILIIILYAWFISAAWGIRKTCKEQRKKRRKK